MPEERPAAMSVRLLAAVALSAALAPLNSTMIAVALPDMGRALGADAGLLRQSLVTSYLLTSIALQGPGGKIGDRIGHRRTLAVGQIVFAVGAALAFAFARIPALAIARVMMAAGGAVIVPSATALLRTELPERVRGRAFGAFGATMALSAAIGPKVGAALVTRFGWSSIFLANVPVILIAAALAHLGGPAPAAPAPARPRARFDVAGSALLTVCLTAIVLGVESARLRPMAAVGAILLVPFALWERRVPDPVVDFSLFRLRAFVGGGAIIALHNLAMYALIFELPHVAARALGAGPREVGSTLIALMATMVLASPIAGRASERFGARPMAVLGSAVGAAGAALLALRPLGAISDALPSLVLLGLGLGLTASPSQAAAMSAAPADRSGMAAGLLATMRYFGGVAGLAILGLVMGESTDPAVVMREHRVAAAVFTGALVAAALAALALPSRPAPARPRS